MNIALIILVVLKLIGLGLTIGKNGETIKISAMSTFISAIISFILYYFAFVN